MAWLRSRSGAGRVDGSASRATRGRRPDRAERPCNALNAPIQLTTAGGESDGPPSREGPGVAGDGGPGTVHLANCLQGGTVKGWWVRLCLCTFVPAGALPEATNAVQPDTQVAAPSEGRASLQELRTFIENTEDSMPTRRIQAEKLLHLATPEATDVAIELLGNSAAPSTRMVVCDAIASLGVTDPELLHAQQGRLVEALLSLLADSAEGVSPQAARALAAFPDSGVTRRLGELAGSVDAPIHQRIGAVRALALNGYRRDVVRQLIRLLPTEDGEFRAAILDALRSTCQEDFGDDVARWRQWGQEQEDQVSDIEWMTERARRYYQRLTVSQRELQGLRESFDQQRAVLAARVTALLREVYRLTPQPAQKDEALLRWLKDPLVEFQLGGLAIVRDQIQDGNLPSDAVVTAVMGELDNSSPAIRRAVLGIVGALNVPNSANAVLASLADERDVSVRPTALRVLGQCRDPVAIPALIAELKDPAAPLECVSEAAVSLGVLGGKGKVDPSVIAPAIPVLLQRLEQAPEDDLRLREALLRAMAGVCAPEFADVFAAHLALDEPQLLLPAIRGVVCLPDARNLDRLVTLTGHADPRVREVACEALGALGSEPAHLETLIGRLSPTAESSDAVRQAAWAAWRDILRRKPPRDRLQWVERLPETPDRAIAYLHELISDLASHNPPPPELNLARRQLASLYVKRGDFAAALPLWQQLFEGFRAANGPETGEVGIALLSAALAAGRPNVARETMLQLATADPDVKRRVTETVTHHIDTALASDGRDALAALLDALRTLPPDAYGENFTAFLTATSEALQPSAPTTAPAESTPE
jgi:HEAT repeat protein